ncbi:glycosyltransferase family 2 protein [Paenibacillus sp. FSL M8-0334]|uniref:glycosyltransferase family 2 protein n=1 Tax=Paenibacillus sp. FSL M8-0334 TaxID=2921623 RepID=UPI0030F9DF5B
MKILVVIPAFNEEKNLVDLINRIGFLNECQVNVIVINDKSTDNTISLLNNMKVEYIDLPCNLGIGGAVQTGYKYAELHDFDIAIQVDGDGQHDPHFIKDLIDPLIEGRADMVIGSRYIKKEGFQSSIMRRVGIRYFSLVINLLTGVVVTDPTSGFRACNSKVIRQFVRYYPVDYPEPESIVSLLRNGFKIEEIPVVMAKRQNGKSSINKFKSIYYMFKVSLAIFIDMLRQKQKKLQS